MYDTYKIYRSLCAEAVDIGKEAMNKIVGKPFGEAQLHRKNRVLPLAAMDSSVKVKEIIPVNTMQLFSRIICIVKSDDNFADCWQY
jgi:hypothetical protein